MLSFAASHKSKYLQSYDRNTISKTMKSKENLCIKKASPEELRNYRYDFLAFTWRNVLSWNWIMPYTNKICLTYELYFEFTIKLLIHERMESFTYLE